MVHRIDSFPGREIHSDGETYLYFGGTAYLGLQTDAQFQQRYIQNIKRYGTSYGASRKSNVRLSIFDDVEEYLADWVGSEGCITLSSGYLAAQLVVQSLVLEKHSLFHAPRTHSAMVLPGFKPYTTYTELDHAIRDQLTKKKDSAPVVLLDSIDFSGSNYPDFENLRTLPLEEIILVVDDSHGIGVVGVNGGGVYRMVKALGAKELIVCSSLGKGLGIQGGAVFGTSQYIHALTKTALYGGASPAAPASMATLLESRKIYAQKKTRLQNNIELFLNYLEHFENFIFMDEHPAFSYSDTKLTDYLATKKILVTSFPYPDEDARLMNRIVLNAYHTPKDIETLATYINHYKR